jgi:hypothetical protein
MNTETKFQATEIAYQLANAKNGYALGPMKRYVAKTQVAFDKKVADIAEKDGQIYGVRAAEVAS